MKCSKATRLMQLYLDGRLDSAQFVHLQDHMNACAECRHDLVLFESINESVGEFELMSEPTDLTERIMHRIAALEAQRAIARRPEFLPPWVANRRTAALAVVALFVVALLQPGGIGGVAANASRSLVGLANLLFSPGPDSVLWIVWVAGALVALVCAIWFIRADASSEFRRAISHRLPQLW